MIPATRAESAPPMTSDQQPIATHDFVPLAGDLRGFYAAPHGPGPFPGVLVYQEAFGVNEYVRSEVRRLAAHGYAAIAPDLFRGETYPYGDERAFAKLRTLRDDALLADVRAAADFLQNRAEVRDAPFGAVGFCMGGRLAVLTAIALGDRIAAAASFYGGGIAPEQQRFFPPIVDRLPEAQAELLLIYGADDASIAPEEHARIAETLSRAKKRYTLSVYPDAGHGFASRDRESYRAEPAEGAWQETLALFARTLTPER